MSEERSRPAETRTAALHLLDDIEPNVHHLSGLVVALRVLGEARDSVEPIAIAALARCAGETVDEIERKWRSALDIVRKDRGR